MLSAILLMPSFIESQCKYWQPKTKIKNKNIYRTLDTNLQIRNLVLKLFLKIDFAMYSPTKIHWQNHTTSLIIGNYSL